MLLKIVFTIEVNCGVREIRIWNAERRPRAGVVGISCGGWTESFLRIGRCLCGYHRWNDSMVAFLKWGDSFWAGLHSCGKSAASEQCNLVPRVIHACERFPLAVGPVGMWLQECSEAEGLFWSRSLGLWRKYSLDDVRKGFHRKSAEQYTPSTGTVHTRWCLPTKCLEKAFRWACSLWKRDQGRGDGWEWTNGFVQKEQMPLKVAGWNVLWQHGSIG